MDSAVDPDLLKLLSAAKSKEDVANKESPKDQQKGTAATAKVPQVRSSSMRKKSPIRRFLRKRHKIPIYILIAAIALIVGMVIGHYVILSPRESSLIPDRIGSDKGVNVTCLLVQSRNSSLGSLKDRQSIHLIHGADWLAVTSIDQVAITSDHAVPPHTVHLMKHGDIGSCLRPHEGGGRRPDVFVKEIAVIKFLPDKTVMEGKKVRLETGVSLAGKALLVTHPITGIPAYCCIMTD